MVKEGSDERSVQVFEAEAAGSLAEAVSSEAQEKREGELVGLDGVGTRLALMLEALGEEGLNEAG
jgi:hypothetical protein